MKIIGVFDSTKRNLFVFTEQDSELDRESHFCLDLYTQYAFNDIKFG